jgi:hypothetical protein
MKAIRQIKSISISETRWLAYATAGVAGALGLSSSAEAEIHYSGNVSIKLTGNAQASLPLSNGASLVFENIDPGSTFWQDFDFLINGAISGSAHGYFPHGDFFNVSNLPAGENVSAGRFYSVAGNPGIGALISAWSDGAFSPIGGSGRGFVGFRFNTGNGTQYGWARIQTRNDNNNHLHDGIKDYAWGDVGDAILTGQKHSLQPANATSLPGSLGLLAFGAQGLDVWRTQRPEKSD